AGVQTCALPISRVEPAADLGLAMTRGSIRFRVVRIYHHFEGANKERGQAHLPDLRMNFETPDIRKSGRRAPALLALFYLWSIIATVRSVGLNPDCPYKSFFGALAMKFSMSS